MKTNIADIFVDELYAIANADLPDSAVLYAKRCLLDYLGATLAGACAMRQKGNKLLEELGPGLKGSAVIGFGRRADPQTAAFINGLSSHIAELDDGVISGIVHPGAPVFSALLPVAEKEKSSGHSFLKGVIVGYEAVVRLADAIQPSHKKRGYHATATCGTIGAAMGIAIMLGFSKSQIKNALSTAIVSAAGTLKVLEDDSELKPFNVGQAAINGVLAACLAKTGFAGPSDAFSGTAGFFSMMADEYDVSHLKNAHAHAWGIERVYVKPYAACRYCHPAIEAALSIRSAHSIAPESIESVRVATYLWAVAKHDHTHVNGTSSAKMSIPYSVAVALVCGTAGLNEYADECIYNPAIIALAKKVSVRADDNLTAMFPQKSPAVVEIKTITGESYVKRIDCPKGEPENPLSNEELEEKFISLAGYGGKTEKGSREIITMIWDVEKSLHNIFTRL